MMAQYCEKKNMKKKAIEFHIMAGKRDLAFIIAQSAGLMEHHSDIIDNYDITNEERIKIAQYFENKAKWGPAAQ